jgi:hypothetical protein
MKKRSRPSFLRQLEERYGPRRKALEDATRKEAETQSRMPVVYPVPGKRRKPPARTSEKGFIDMSVQQFVVLALFFVFLAAAASGAVAYGAVELAGGGPHGEVGPAGPQGPQGVEGGVGPQGPPGDDAAQEMLKRLATMWAVQQLSVLQGGAFVEFNHAQVASCVQYVITGEPNVGACPGFSQGTR